ncbi:Hypothetical protein ABZS17G119_03642 [Kosakonia cowanii]
MGPQGESIWTDRYGRVKVKFHWDRLAKGDDSSSCWVRVSSAWAGQGFGGVQVPRIGDEVVVDFINGDPDRPLITGRVYNESSMPPWELPAGTTVMGFMTRSKDGSKDNASYLFFEDKPGSEYHRINKHLVAILTLKYSYEGKMITSKRGVIFWVTDREKFVPGTPIKIRINPEKPTDFYYLEYETR